MIAVMIFNSGNKLHHAARKIIGLAGLLWVNPFLSMPASADSGQAPYEQCGFCHEYDGNSRAGNYPKIAGMKPQYLLKQLLDYKSGQRNGDGKMQEAASLLSKQDMQEVVAYFAGQKRTPEPAMRADVDYRHAEELAIRGDHLRFIVACNACHNSDNPEFPSLKGQHADYIAQELFAFKRKTRRNDDPSIMRYLAERLSDKEIRQLSEYLAAGGQTQ